MLSLVGGLLNACNQLQTWECLSSLLRREGGRKLSWDHLQKKPSQDKPLFAISWKYVELDGHSDCIYIVHIEQCFFSDTCLYSGTNIMVFECKSDNFHTTFDEFFWKLYTYLGHIGMLIPWLKKSWNTKSETPGLVLTIQNSVFLVSSWIIQSLNRSFPILRSKTF